MEISSSHQMQIFIISVSAGLLCGLFFDVQRVLRKKHFAGVVRTNMEDILFIIFCAFTTIFVGFYFDEGAIRSYLILGISGGTLFYFAFLSCVVSRVVEVICNIISKIVIMPVLKIAVKIRLLMKKIVKMCGKINRRKTAVWQRIKSRAGLLKKRVKML